MEDWPNLCGLLRISELYHYKTVQPEIMLLVLRLSRLLLKSLTTLCAYGNFALHKIVPQYVLSPSAYVHPYEVCRRRRRAATVVRSSVVDASQKAKIAEKVHKPTLTVNAINFELIGFTVVCILVRTASFPRF